MASEFQVKTNCFEIVKLPTTEYYRYNVGMYALTVSRHPNASPLRILSEAQDLLQATRGHTTFTNSVAPATFRPKALYDGDAIIYSCNMATSRLSNGRLASIERLELDMTTDVDDTVFLATDDYWGCNWSGMLPMFCPSTVDPNLLATLMSPGRAFPVSQCRWQIIGRGSPVHARKTFKVTQFVDPAAFAGIADDGEVGEDVAVDGDGSLYGM
ncbi:hypothetical protein BDZ89DRAFT_1135415 [Hymenopellis radicata]|nr:hypothetical protein BDZ89DRAFT_1135415 [Hymenopellis radicata]